MPSWSKHGGACRTGSSTICSWPRSTTRWIRIETTSTCTWLSSMNSALRRYSMSDAARALSPACSLREARR